MLRAVVDTNVLVSAVLSPNGAPAAVVGAIRQLRLVRVVCAEILAEYHEVLRRPRLKLPTAEVDELLADLQALTLSVDVSTVPIDTNLPDPDDWPFIAAARMVGCRIVTGDRRHFPEAAGVEVVAPAQIIAAIEK